MMNVKHTRSILLALAAGQGVCYMSLSLRGDLRQDIIWAQIWFFVAFMFFVATLAMVHIQRAAPYGQANQVFLSGNPVSDADTKWLLKSIILCACGFRLILWFSTPELSDDIYRYVWEGKIFAAGWNPFVYAPENPSLTALRDAEIFPRINHPQLAAIYPPLSLFIFRLCAHVSSTVSAMKMTFILFDLFTIGILVRTLYALNMSSLNVIIYAWNPLVIVEFAGSGHLDSAGIFFLMLALYLFIKRKNLVSIITVTLSFLVKFLPVLFLPFMLGTRKALRLFVFGAIVALGYVPFVSAGEKIFDSLIHYSQRWVFNASVYEVAQFLCGDGLRARIISAAALFGLLLWFVLRRAVRAADVEPESIYRTVFILMGSTFVLTPVLYPWYLCWIIPLLVIIPNRAWLMLSGTVFLSYLVWKGYVETGIWKENVWVKIGEYTPFYSLLLYDSIRSFRQRNSIV